MYGPRLFLCHWGPLPVSHLTWALEDNELHFQLMVVERCHFLNCVQCPHWKSYPKPPVPICMILEYHPPPLLH